MENSRIEVIIRTSIRGNRYHSYHIDSELIHTDNVRVWAEYLGETIQTLVNTEAMQSDLFQMFECRIQKEKERIIFFT